MSIAKFRWCEDVCSYVRFRPDHEAIRRELYAHMEDSVQELLASGMGEEEAEKTMLGRMGNPMEVGKQLDAVHKPALGWLWVASKWLVILCLAAAAFLLVTAPSRLYLDLEDLSGGSLSDSRRVWGCADYSDGYLFSVDQVALWENGDTTDGAGTVKLKLTVWDLIGNGGMTAIYNFYLTDSEGGRHPYISRWDDTGGADTPYTADVYTRILSECYIISVDNIPWDTEWVELRYTAAGRNIVLRAELPGGEVS